MKNRTVNQYTVNQYPDAGFSILEVLAVMIIIGILGALAAPGWLTFMSRQRATAASDQVQQAIRMTQAEAKRLRRTRSIQFYNTADSTTGVPEIEMNASGLRETLGQGELDPGTIELTATDDNGNPVSELVFRTDGSVSVENDDYNVTPPELPVTITLVSPPGSNTKRCLSVRTLLGSIDTAKDNDCP